MSRSFPVAPAMKGLGAHGESPLTCPSLARCFLSVPQGGRKKTGYINASAVLGARMVARKRPMESRFIAMVRIVPLPSMPFLSSDRTTGARNPTDRPSRILVNFSA
jgi:hypothetical protein